MYCIAAMGEDLKMMRMQTMGQHERTWLTESLEWIMILGKLHDTRSLSGLMGCMTVFTKMMTQPRNSCAVGRRVKCRDQEACKRCVHIIRKHARRMGRGMVEVQVQGT